MGLSFFNLALAFFVSWQTILPYCPIAFAMLHLGSCSLGLLWTCLALSFYSVHVAQYYCWVCSHTILGFLGLFYSFGHSRPASFLWASSAHSNPSFSWDFVKSFELPWPNYHIFYFQSLLALLPTSFTNSFLWAPLAHFCLLSISHNSHGFTISFFGLS